MKRICLFTLSILALTTIVFSQDSTMATDSITFVLDTILATAKKIQENGGGALGIYAIGAAVVNLLLALLKLKPLSKWLNHDKFKPYKPYFALGLGIVGGIFTELSRGQAFVQCLYAGLMMGLGAIGIHEVTRTPGIDKILRKVN